MHAEFQSQRSWFMLLVALAAFLVGVAVGQYSAVRPHGPSRIEWPSPAEPHPRSLPP